MCNATPAARVSALPAAAEDAGRNRRATAVAGVDDVATHADAVLTRLHDGSMPCDGAWAPERIAVFARWVDEGAADS